MEQKVILRRRACYPASTVPTVGVANLPSSVACAYVGGLDTAWRNGIAGHAGRVSIGMLTPGVGRFDGDVFPPQRFHGYVRVGAKVKPSPGGSLPSTVPLTNNSRALLASLSRYPQARG